MKPLVSTKPVENFVESLPRTAFTAAAFHGLGVVAYLLGNQVKPLKSLISHTSECVDL
jgi:hypothetical protein